MMTIQIVALAISSVAAGVSVSTAWRLYWESRKKKAVLEKAPQKAGRTHGQISADFLSQLHRSAFNSSPFEMNHQAARDAAANTAWPAPAPRPRKRQFCLACETTMIAVAEIIDFDLDKGVAAPSKLFLCQGCGSQVIVQETAKK